MPKANPHALLRRIPRWTRFELTSLILMGLTAAALWGFVELADEVLEGSTRSYDETVLLMLRTPGDTADPLGPPWVEEMGRDITALGGTSVLSLLTMAVCIFLMLEKKRQAAAFVLAAVTSGLLLSTLLKLGFDRPRPDLVAHGSIVYTASFPSGHSMLAAVTYLTLGALLARVYGRRRVKVFLLTTAVALTVLVGCSRVYLGVHWPTDVLAGWTAGAAWACICWLGARWLQGRRRLECEADPASCRDRQAGR